MINIEEMNIARKCIDIALSKGANAARVSLNKCVSDSVTMLNGEIDKVTHSADRSLYIYIFADGRYGTFSTNRLDVKEMESMRNVIKNAKKHVIPALAGVVMAVNSMVVPVMAAGDTSGILAPLENLKTLIIAVIGAVGVIILAKNVMEFAQAYQQQDSSTMNSALKGIVAGVMMAGISSVLTFLGF